MKIRQLDSGKVTKLKRVALFKAGQVRSGQVTSATLASSKKIKIQ